jgi:carbonic anhydrase/acetyltransferase-like protein (isoleucine patch superfamily)
VLPATRILPHKSKSPSTEGIAFIAPTASVIGDVKLGSGASVWYGAVVRGDVNFIEIGNGTSIGDGAVVHVAKIAGDIPTIIGKNVNIGPKAVIHACTIGE